MNSDYMARSLYMDDNIIIIIIIIIIIVIIILYVYSADYITMSKSALQVPKKIIIVIIMSNIY